MTLWVKVIGNKPVTNMVEEENWLMRVVLRLAHECYGTHEHNTEINIMTQGDEST